MKCGKCGSEKGFQGRQEVKETTDKKTGLKALETGPERIYCKSCGTEVKPEKAESDKVLPAPPDHLKNEGDKK